MMIERTGWLLDLYEDPLGGLALWFLDDDGARRRLRQRFAITFYAAGPPGRLRQLETWLEVQPVPLQFFMDQRRDVFAGRDVPVLAVQVPRPPDLAPLFRQVSRAFPDLDFADADLPVGLRYAAATGVSVLCRCRVVLDGADFVQSITPLSNPWELDPVDPPLRVLSLEPDCSPAHAVPRALHIQSGGPGLPGEQRALRLGLAPARSLLINLRALLQEYDPDLLLTTWGDTWLLPRLLQLSEEHGLLLPLNRDPAAGIIRRKERWYFSYGQIVYRGEQVHLFGRWHVDRQNAMMWTDYELDGVLEMARVTGLPLQTAARVSPGTGISTIQMTAALNLGILVPWQKQQVEEIRPAADLFAADQGGLVFQPIMGVHRNVAEIDFVSMYPAIMVRFDISPETIGHGSVGHVPEIGLSIDQGIDGLIPQALRPLLQKRVNLKRRLAGLPAWDPRLRRYQGRAAALKWLLVTCFGYLGYKNARFGRIEAHQAVTAYGRETLLRAKTAAEDLGFDVLHLYVDALWVRQEGKDCPEDFQALLDAIHARSGLPIALDGIYRWVVFLPSRVNSRRPVANRYFGVFQNGEIKMRGIAARRKDTAAWVAKTQIELLKILAHPLTPEEALPKAIEYVRLQLAQLNAGLIKLEQFLVFQRISRDLEDYHTPSPAARAALQLREIGKLVKPGQRVVFLFTLGEPGVFAWDLPTKPKVEMLDIPQYQKLLLRAAEEVLAPFASGQSISERIKTAGMKDCL